MSKAQKILNVFHFVAVDLVMDLQKAKYSKEAAENIAILLDTFPAIVKELFHQYLDDEMSGKARRLPPKVVCEHKGPYMGPPIVKDKQGRKLMA